MKRHVTFGKEVRRDSSGSHSKMSLISREPLEGAQPHRLDAAGTEQDRSCVAKDSAANLA